MTFADLMGWTVLLFGGFVSCSIFVNVIVGRWAAKKLRELEEQDRDAAYAMEDFPSWKQ